MDMTNLRAANVARDQEWNTGSERVSMTFRATELAGEVGEACNVIKKLERERIGLVGSRDTKEHLAEELADIVICTDLVAMDAGIDLDAAITAKFNATSEKNGLSTRLSKPMSVTARPFEATPEMVKAALDLVWEDSETHDDLVCRLWRTMAAVTSDQPSAARELALEEAARLCDVRAEQCAEEHQIATLASVKAALAGARSEAMHLAHSIRALSSPDHTDSGKVEGDGSAAARDVLAERRRQVEAEGWTSEHDDQHSNGEMARAASCYISNKERSHLPTVPLKWPWSDAWWKPDGYRRNLIKAGALILAEIERLDRLSAPASEVTKP